jgi:hypothetical protein
VRRLHRLACRHLYGTLTASLRVSPSTCSKPLRQWCTSVPNLHMYSQAL